MSRPCCSLRKIPVTIGRQHGVELFGAVDDPVAVGEPQHKPVDECQRDVAQIVDDGGIQFGPVRQELHQDVVMQLGECVGGALQDVRQSPDRGSPAWSARSAPWFGSAAALRRTG